MVRKHERQPVGYEKAFGCGEDAVVLDPDETRSSERRENIFGVGSGARVGESKAVTCSQSEQELLQTELLFGESL